MIVNEEIIAQERQLRSDIYAHLVANLIANDELSSTHTYTNLYRVAKEAAGEFMQHEYGKMYIDAKGWQQKAK